MEINACYAMLCYAPYHGWRCLYIHGFILDNSLVHTFKSPSNIPPEQLDMCSHHGITNLVKVVVDPYSQ